MNPLPPQAYTKETLVLAYQWLQNQSDSIKEMATSPDTLVSLYLKTKAFGPQVLERPSIQNFKNELKNLAGMMGEFEVYDGKPPQSASAPTQMGFSQMSLAQQMPTHTAQPPQAPHSAQNPASSHSFASSQAQQHANAHSSQYSAPQSQNSHQGLHMSQSTPQSPTQRGNAAQQAHDLDPRSLAYVQETRKQFNLSSDAETLRLLIATGAQTLQKILK